MGYKLENIKVADPLDYRRTKYVPVQIEVALKVDGRVVTLSQQEERSLLNSIRLPEMPPVNGRVSVIVVAETSPS